MTEPMTEQYASERIRLAEAMGWRYEFYEEPELSVRGMRWRDPSGSVHVHYKLQDPPFNPFKDANDEAAVFDHFSRQPFSERKKFFDALKDVVDQNIAFLTTTNEAHEIAWPWVLMYMRRGDIARAALRVLAQSMRYPDGFKCVHCGYIGDVSEPPHVCKELEQCHTCGGVRKYCGCGDAGEAV